MGKAKSLAISLAGFTAIGLLIYHFRSNIVSGAGKIGSTLGQSVGIGFGSIPSGLLQGAQSANLQLSSGIPDFLKSLIGGGFGPNFGGIFGPTASATGPTTQGPAANQTPTQGGNAGLTQTSPNPPPALATNNNANIIPITADFNKILQATNTVRNVARTSSGYVFQAQNVGVQPINQSVGLTSTGQARIGSVGLGVGNIQKSVDLSKALGGPVFDTQGNLVALNGIRLAR